MDLDNLIFRKAKIVDLPEIVRMLADDILGTNREDETNLEKYKIAFAEISADKNNFLAVVEFDNKIIATCHLTLMPSLVMQGSKRMNIEAVRVHKNFTGQKIGSWMMQKAIDFAKDNQVQIIQLTTNKKRNRAHKFYENLGFEKTHEGMKLKL